MLETMGACRVDEECKQHGCRPPILSNQTSELVADRTISHAGHGSRPLASRHPQSRDVTPDAYLYHRSYHNGQPLKLHQAFLADYSIDIKQLPNNGFVSSRSS